MSPARFTRAQLQSFRGAKVDDLIEPGVRLLFVGINPGLYSAAVGHHFARPGNRFWPALHASGFTPRLLSPHEERELLRLGYGITNLVPRATASADELSPEELAKGGPIFSAKIRQYRPRFVAVLGIGAYRTALGRPRAALGLQAESLGSTKLWVLPSPSGLNAHYQAHDLAKMFRELREAVEAEPR